MKRLLTTGAGLCALLLANGANAASCGITAVSGVVFGNYNVFSGSNTDSSGSVTYQCTIIGALDVIYLDIGKSNLGAGSFLPRTMLSSGHTLNYNLYINAGRNIVWGDGSAGTQRFGPTLLNLLPVTVTIYGRIPALQNAFFGSYTDTVVITANF